MSNDIAKNLKLFENMEDPEYRRKMAQLVGTPEQVEQVDIEDKVLRMFGYDDSEESNFLLCLNIVNQFHDRYPHWPIDELVDEAYWLTHDWPEGEGFGSSDSYGVYKSMSDKYGTGEEKEEEIAEEEPQTLKDVFEELSKQKEEK